ncbi:MAG: histidine--tRNA ligase [Bacteroidetes bacterium]|nr:histidine--tRNA ligase [Bacteroidota bacterium]
MAQQPSIPKGTRDFSPAEMVKRNFIFDTVKSVFQLYGYQPIETPAMENLSTLLGKYGEEGDKLLFKILNSGDYLDKIPKEKFQKKIHSEFTGIIAEKGLRYDLTVPFARFVVQNRNEIIFPFKRYQIQPVWRADKPQKGRYREFFQCDVDVIGSNSLMNEVELVLIANDVFKKLGIKNTVKINNRKVLFGIAEFLGETDKFNALTVAIDKLDKIGIQKVEDELILSGFNNDSIEKLKAILEFNGTNKEKIDFLETKLNQTQTGSAGVREISVIYDLLESLNLSSDVIFDLTLARGLNYYTGAIFEVVAKDVKIGSICGGGRYDDLTGIFGLPGISGVGVSFGADRIFDVMLELNLFPEQTTISTKVMFVSFGEKEQKYCLPLVDRLRSEDINTEIYPDLTKLKKQMSYADSRKIPFVVLVGENEMAENLLTVKEMATGKQDRMTFADLILKLKNL